MFSFFRKQTTRRNRRSTSRNRSAGRGNRLRIERLETRAMFSASGDFNGDGFDDLAIGAAGDDFNGRVDVGAVNVIYGSGAKLTTTGNQLWTLDSPGINGVGHNGDRFGSALTIGDFNGDGFDDLAVGSQSFDTDGLDGAGVVNIIYGSAKGLTAKDDQQFSESTSGIDGIARKGHQFGCSLAAGDFDGDGRDDLAIGAVGEKLSSSLDHAGAVHVLYGGASGLSATGDQMWTYDSPGINGVADSFDYFGQSLAAGDFNHDGRDDLAIGAPSRKVFGYDAAGAVTVIYGSTEGLAATGDQYWRQSVDGLLGSPAQSTYFGQQLAAGDFNGDGFDDLAMSAPLADSGMIDGAGNVTVLYGSAQKLSTSQQQLFTEATLGLTTGDNHRFGGALTTGDFNGDGFDELAIGITGFDLAAAQDGGLVAVVRGGAIALTNVSPMFYTQNTANIVETAENAERFGGGLTAGDYNGDGRADLVIAVLESFGGHYEAGAVHVLYGGNLGPTTTGGQFFTQESNRILGDAANGDWFGTALA